MKFILIFLILYSSLFAREETIENVTITQNVTIEYLPIEKKEDIDTEDIPEKKDDVDKKEVKKEKKKILKEIKLKKIKLLTKKLELSENDTSTKYIIFSTNDYIRNYGIPCKFFAIKGSSFYPKKDIVQDFKTWTKGDLNLDKISVPVNVKDDNLIENSEYFRIDCYAPTKKVIYEDGSSSFKNWKTYSMKNGSIKDNDISITINKDTIFSESESKNKTLDFNIAFSEKIQKDIRLEYTLKTIGSLKISEDIVEPTYFIDLKKGTKKAHISIKVLDDDIIENAEYFKLTLIKPSGNFGFINKTARGIILDDDIVTMVPEGKGNYTVFENGTSQEKISTKKSGDKILFDVVASNDFEVLSNKKVIDKKVCDKPICTIKTAKNGLKYKECYTTCTITKTTVINYSDSMNISDITLRRFKNYNSNDNTCSNELLPKIIAKNVKVKSNGKFVVSVPSDKIARCAWIEINGESAHDYKIGKTKKLKGYSDTFAIKPYSFMIKKSNKDSKIRAGNDFNISISAIDKKGAVIKDYSSKKDDYIIEDNLDVKGKSNCNASIKSKYSLKDIKNGSSIIGVNYNDVGKIKYSIKEAEGQEYAIIDKKDCDFYKIDSNETEIEVIANSMEVDTSYENGNNISTFTYFNNYNPNSDDNKNMSAKIVTKIDMLNLEGKKVQNFTEGCYAKDVNYIMNYEVISNNDFEYKILTAYEDGEFKQINKSNILLSGDKIKRSGVVEFNQYKIEKELFKKGEALKIAKFNFARDKAKAINPMKIVFLKESLSILEDGFLVENNLDKELSFYYGRLHVPNYTGIGKEHSLTAYQEVYCNGCDKSIFTYADGSESEDGINWFIVEKSQYNSNTNLFSNLKGSRNDYKPFNSEFMSSTSSYATLEGVDTISFNLHQIPLKERITYTPKTWLLYKRFSSGLEHSFYLDISAKAENWAGKGTQGKGIDNDGGSTRKYQNMDW